MNEVQDRWCMNIILFKNGNRYSGRRYTVKPGVRNMMTLLNSISISLTPTNGAVKSLYDAVTGRKVKNLNQLVNGKKYVAAGDEKLKFISKGYLTKAEQELVNAQETASKTDEKFKNNIIIHVFNNGVTNLPAKKFVLTSKDIKTWSATMDFIAKTLGCVGTDVKDLYTVNGKKINAPSQLHNEGFYVAVNYHKEFRHGNYMKTHLCFTKNLEKTDVGVHTKADINERLRELKHRSKSRINKMLEEAKLFKFKECAKYIIIHVFKNGEAANPKKFVLTQSDFINWSRTKGHIASSLGFSDDIKGLYTTDGRLLQGPPDLENNGYYVGVPYSNQGFQRSNYMSRINSQKPMRCYHPSSKPKLDTQSLPCNSQNSQSFAMESKNSADTMSDQKDKPVREQKKTAQENATAAMTPSSSAPDLD